MRELDIKVSAWSLLMKHLDAHQCQILINSILSDIRICLIVECNKNVKQDNHHNERKNVVEDHAEGV